MHDHPNSRCLRVCVPVCSLVRELPAMAVAPWPFSFPELLDAGEEELFDVEEQGLLLELGLLAGPPATSLPLLGAFGRCLDGTHAQPCTACAPAPSEEEEEAFELRADAAGQRTGERRLRSLVSRTPEWCSLEERLRVAGLCASRRPRLAAALRSRQSAELRKGDLLWLCALWGYRSHVWARKKDGPGGGRRAVPAEPAPPPATPPELLPAVQALATGWLGQRASESVACFSNTSRSRFYHAILRQGTWPAAAGFAAAAAAKKRGNAAAAVAELRGVSAALDDLLVYLRGARQGLAPAAAGAPAWAGLAADQELEAACGRAELCLARLRGVCGMAMRLADPVPPALLAALAAEAAGAPGRDLSHVSNGDPNCALGGRSALELCTHVGCLLAQLRREGTLAVFLEGTCALLALLRSQAEGLATGAETHLAILSDALAETVP